VTLTAVDGENVEDGENELADEVNEHKDEY